MYVQAIYANLFACVVNRRRMNNIKKKKYIPISTKNILYYEPSI